MPCLSANTFRFGGGQQSKARAKTAFRGPGESIGSPLFQPLRECRPGYRDRLTRPSDDPVESVSEEVLRECKPGYREKIYIGSDRNELKKLQANNAPNRQAILPQPELQRIKELSKVVTLEERLEELARQEEETRRMDKDAEMTRQRYKKMDDYRHNRRLSRKNNEELEGVEKLKVLERAFIAKQEREEELRDVNRIILNAKCDAVRQAQIEEKRCIQRMRSEEDKRIENVVVERALKDVSKEDEAFEKQKSEKRRYADEIRKQLIERELLRAKEAERLKEEAKILRKADKIVKKEEQRKYDLQKKRRDQFLEELAEIKERAEHFRTVLREQEKEAEMKVAAYMTEKKKRDDRLKLEQRVKKESFERQQQRLYTLAQKALESKTRRDEMAYEREQEEIEREYRNKEKDLAAQRRKMDDELYRIRKGQLQELRLRQAKQLARAEEEFNQMIDNIKQEDDKYKESVTKIEKRRQCYRAGLLRQIEAKATERERLEEKKNDLLLSFKDDERERTINLRTIINIKLRSMRASNLPEKYIQQVEKRLQDLDAPPMVSRLVK